jgi:hypothetical protein
MRRLIVLVTAVASITAIAAAAWRRNRRLGTRFVNRVVNPLLLRRRLAGWGRSEIGMLEHIGRSSGIRRLTPVHPERTERGFRIIAPLGTESEWARNVLAAGHCRLQLHDVIYDLDEPALVAPTEVDGIPAVLRRVETALGFRYLTLRTFAEAPGQFEEEEVAARQVPSAEPEAAPVGAVASPQPARRPTPRVAAESPRAPRRHRPSRAAANGGPAVEPA